MKHFTIASCLCLFGVVEALLPPLYTSLNEYKALLNDKRLEEALGAGQFIQEIHREENGFKIITPKYILLVEVNYEPSTVPGPGKFKLNFHDPELLHE